MFNPDELPKRVGFLVILLILGATHPLVAQDEASTEKFKCKQMLEIMDAVLDNHIDPPAKQQMILSGARALYTAPEHVPADLSRKVSSLASNEDITTFLESLRNDQVTAENEASQRSRFIDAMLASVPGEASLLPAKEAKVRAQLEANRYVGIGIALTTINGLPTITKSMYGGSGYQAGVRDNDVILEVDGKSTKAKALSVVVDELRGDEGTEVTLVLQQPKQESRTLTITRRVTFIPTIKGTREVAPGQWEYTIDSSPDIAILKFLQIGPSTAHELKKIEAELRNRNLRGIVLDLRNAGGTLHDLVILADQLLDSGVLGRLRDVHGEVVHTMQPGCLWKNVPMVALVDSVTGAGPTYLAAALQDSNRAKVVGDIPIGNAYTQSRVQLSDGASLQLASGILYRASGVALVRANIPNSQFDWEASTDKTKLNYLLPDIGPEFASQFANDWLLKAVESFSSRRQDNQDSDTK